jgi:hypothetical protein
MGIWQHFAHKWCAGTCALLSVLARPSQIARLSFLLEYTSAPNLNRSLQSYNAVYQPEMGCLSARPRRHLTRSTAVWLVYGPNYAAVADESLASHRFPIEMVDRDTGVLQSSTGSCDGGTAFQSPPNLAAFVV